MGLPAPGYQPTWIGLYPAGPNPWNGQPLGVQPATLYYTPNQKLPAEEANWLFGSLYFGFNLLRAYVGPPSWMPDIPYGTQYFPTLNNNAGFQTVLYDVRNNQWLIGVATLANGFYVNVTHGKDPGIAALSDLNNPQLGAASSAIINASRFVLSDDLTTAGVYHMVSVLNDGSNNGKVFYWKFLSGTWSGTALPFTTLTSSGTDTQTVEMVRFGSTQIVLAVGNTNTTVGTATSLFHYNGTAWNACSGTNIFGAVPWWYLKTNGSIIMAMPGALAGVTSGGKYLTSNDGVTWTTQTLPGAVQGSNDQIVGLCYGADAVGPCWILAIWNSSTSKTRFYRSTDGITSWLAQSSPSTAFTVLDMEAQGSLIVAALQVSTQSTAIISIDGGVTWYDGGVGLPSGLSPSASTNQYIRPRVIWSPTQLTYLNNFWLRWTVARDLPLSPL